ncbi:hypothetical protein WICPIJ_001235 [Wickerhamomyces pijperi]|uniref:Uncharacterized protein n=1 Tax=Wickerhamomyces pijperi TaxID=599730 RepID=A0A9P8QBZ2_WICPI|nr:hypothetical protein WICPIJ_001235 [Wickerhamomyces pijperi]
MEPTIIEINMAHNGGFMKEETLAMLVFRLTWPICWNTTRYKIPLEVIFSRVSSAISSHSKFGRVWAKATVKDTGKELELPKTLMAVTKFVSGSSRPRYLEVTKDKTYANPVDTA